MWFWVLTWLWLIPVDFDSHLNMDLIAAWSWTWNFRKRARPSASPLRHPRNKMNCRSALLVFDRCKQVWRGLFSQSVCSHAPCECRLLVISNCESLHLDSGPLRSSYLKSFIVLLYMSGLSAYSYSLTLLIALSAYRTRMVRDEWDWVSKVVSATSSDLWNEWVCMSIRVERTRVQVYFDYADEIGWKLGSWNGVR